MEQSIQNKLVAFDAIVIWGADHPLTPAIPLATALLTQMSTVATALRTNNASQIGGNHEFRSGVSTRRLAADALLTQMRPINEIARALRRDEFPGVRELFRMPRSDGYATLTGTAQSFVDKLGPIKSTFVDRGLPADFDEQLANALVAVTAANTIRAGGKAEQVGGTAGLEARAKEGMLVLHELDSILSYQYRDNPVLLAAWKSTCHVEQDPVREDDEPPAGGSQGSQPTALANNTVTETAASSNGRESLPGGVEPRVNGTNGGVLVG